MSFTDKFGVIFEDVSSYKSSNNQNKILEAISAKKYKYTIKDFAGNSQNCEIEIKNKEQITSHLGGEVIKSTKGGCSSPQSVSTKYCSKDEIYTQFSCPYDTSTVACPTGTKEISRTDFCSSGNITVN